MSSSNFGVRILRELRQLFRRAAKLPNRPDMAAQRAGGKDTQSSTRSHHTIVKKFRHHRLEDRGHDNIVRVGLVDRMWSDLYHHALTVRWSTFLWSSLFLYIAINVCFASLYMMTPGQIGGVQPSAFWDLFFFSVQTLSTVGYGAMAPTGPMAHVIVSFELLVGMMLNAVATGLVFARFSRPKPQVMFSDRALMHSEDGMMCPASVLIRNLSSFWAFL
ncbi:ion channel [Acidocella aminolytica]|uniref:ion channel n=1 Tax=Acidocella aminolytica TaxID=33998 RepID=UPI001FD4FE3A|nr:ion channel [Acidocella aminolytica]